VEGEMGACNWQRELTSTTGAHLCDLVVCGCPRSPSLFSLGSNKHVGVGLIQNVTPHLEVVYRSDALCNVPLHLRHFTLAGGLRRGCEGVDERKQAGQLP
jgi:hypothetical protein